MPCSRLTPFKKNIPELVRKDNTVGKRVKDITAAYKEAKELLLL